MPTYDYECNACGHGFETIQSMSDEVLKTCPQCGREDLRRLIGIGSGIIFKGSGFYVNDSRKVAAPDSKKSEEKKPAVSDSKSKKVDEKKVSA